MIITPGNFINYFNINADIIDALKTFGKIQEILL